MVFMFLMNNWNNIIYIKKISENDGWIIKCIDENK